MGDHRQLIRQLAQSDRLGQDQAANRLRDRAAQIDRQGDFEVVHGELIVNGLRRKVSTVINKAPDASRVEFGRQSGRENSDGRGGLRPLGRAARSAS